VAQINDTIFHVIPTDIVGVNGKWDACYFWNGASFTDETTDINQSTANDVSLPDTIGDIIYFGCASDIFQYILLNIGTVATGSPINVFEYSQGSGNWAALSHTVIAATLELKATPFEARWDVPDDWAIDTVNGSACYWIRIRCTTAPSNSPLATSSHPGVKWSMQTQTLYFPEVTGARGFNSVVLILSWSNNEISGAGVVYQWASARLGANAFSSILTNAIDISDSGEQNAVTISFDLTSLFNAQFGSGANQTLDFQYVFPLSVTASVPAQPGIINICGYLMIDRYYDDSNNTIIKTVPIPIHSNIIALDGTLREFGSDDIPALDTYLAESNKVYRNIGFVLTGNSTAVGTTDSYLDISLEDDVLYTFGKHEGALQSGIFFMVTWVKNDLVTNAVHKFKAKCDEYSTGGKYTMLAPVLYVTYEYNRANSTRLTIGRFEGFNNFSQNGWMGATSGNRQKLKLEILIPEDNPTFLRIGSLNNTIIFAGSTANVHYEDDADTSFAFTNATLCGGMNLLINKKTGITFAKGFNYIYLHHWTGTEGNIFMNSWINIINYSCDKPSAYSETKQRMKLMECYLSKAATTGTSGEMANCEFMDFSTSNYNNPPILWQIILAAISTFYQLLYGKRNVGHFSGNDGWELLYTLAFGNVGEQGIMNFWFCDYGLFKRYADDPDTRRIDPSTAGWSMKWYQNMNSLSRQFFFLWTQHKILAAIEGTISGYAGDGSAIPLVVRRDDINMVGGSKEHILTGASTIGGIINLDYYDENADLVIDARQDATHVGRAETGKGI
jgi:hypothetical protein